MMPACSPRHTVVVGNVLIWVGLSMLLVQKFEKIMLAQANITMVTPDDSLILYKRRNIFVSYYYVENAVTDVL